MFTFGRCLAAVIGVACALAVSPAFAEKRVALVVGNSTYRNVPSLANPANDANLMAETLRAAGFALVGGGAQIDLDKAAFDNAVQSFGTQVVGADVALFYYAGHGVQVRGSNYLVPIAANPAREADVYLQMVDIAVVLSQMEGSGTKLNLVILDACRNNPFGGRGLRATDPGLAQVRAPEGTLISFATQPGNVAKDGADGNSPYTKALAQTIRRGGLDIFQTFNAVGLAVKRSTGGEQQPWVSNSPIDGSFYFVGAPSGPPASSVVAAPAADETFWLTFKDSTAPALFEEFLKTFPSSSHATEAQARLEELKRSQVAVVAPPVVPLVVPAVPSGPCGAGSVTVSLASRAACPLSAAEERALKPKDGFKECDNCPEMVVVPAGAFTMGSPASERGRDKDEGPQHVVTIRQPFAVGKFEVTVDQFAVFVKETGYDAGSTCRTFEGGKAEDREGRSWRNPGFAQAGSHPAACLNWNDAKAYLGWLAKNTGKSYRLLTEAEYEYATRARTTPGVAPRYFFGDDEASMCRYGNGADQTAKTIIPGADKWTVLPCRDGFAYTAPVGSFSANGFGLNDMHGNLLSWTEDCYLDSYAGAPPDGSARISGDCSSRVLRGGSWYSDPGNLRSARRFRVPGVGRGVNNGFRVGRALLTP